MDDIREHIKHATQDEKRKMILYYIQKRQKITQTPEHPLITK